MTKISAKEEFLIASMPVHDPRDHLHLFPSTVEFDENIVSEEEFREFVQCALEDDETDEHGSLYGITIQLAILIAIYSEISDPSNFVGEDENVPSIKLGIANACLPYINNDTFRHNCYSYAAKGTDESMPKSPLWSKAGPGEKAGIDITSDAQLTQEEMVSMSEADGLIFAGFSLEDLHIPKGKRLIAMYLSDKDFHWVRIDRTQDDRIMMSGKLGSADVDVFELINLEDIYYEDFGAGYRFSGFFLTDETGIDVGLDAKYRLEGLISEDATREEVDVQFLNLSLGLAA